MDAFRTLHAPPHVRPGPLPRAGRAALHEEGTMQTSAAPAPKLVVEHLAAGFAGSTILKDVGLVVPDRSVLAVIGPSGCGKTTFLRCLNRMHELVPGAWAKGKLLLDGEDLNAPDVDPVLLRRRVGMVFQRPNPFPTMSVRENVAAGLRLNRVPGDHDAIVERCLRQAALWDEVKDRLDASALSLSGGQQQRLCIARALAVEPEVLLMDEPASALDPIATAKIEDLIHELKATYTIVIVTHNMQQAARISDSTAFLLRESPERPSELVEYGDTRTMFTNPHDKRTESYITGRFG